MSEKSEKEKPRELLRNDRTRCSWCREALPSDSTTAGGIVKVKRQPERVYSDEGRAIGIEGQLDLLWFHEKCFEAYKGIDFSVSCRYCRSWKMNAKAWLIPNMVPCTCICHPKLGKQISKECKILDMNEMKEGLADREAAQKEKETVKQ